MITPSFGLTATERVLPKLALDFTTASLDSRVTFTRAGNTATVTNSSGYVVPINADLPRFDFNPITLVCKGLLIEESRTNIAPQSANFDVSPWTKVGVSLTSNATTAPDGTLTAQKLVETAVTSDHYVQLSLSVSNATTYGDSLYVKSAGDNRTMRILMFNAASPFAAVTSIVLDPATGLLVSGGGSSATALVENAGNGWWRISATGTTGATSVNIRIALRSGSSYSYAGDGTSGVFIWGHQVEAGAFATSYIPTVASQVTRTADVATMTGTNFSSWYNASAGTLSAEFDLIGFAAASYYNIITLTNNTGGNYLSFLKDGVTNNIKLNSNAGGSNIAAIEFSPPVVNTVYQAVTTIKADDIAAAVSASAVQTDTNTGGVLPTIDRLHLGLLTTGIPNYMNGHLRKVEYWKQRVINAEVQAFSKV